MAIRSDLAVVVKPEHSSAFKGFCAENNIDLDTESSYYVDSPEHGLIVVLEDVQTLADRFQSMLQFLANEVGDENFKTVEACSEFPTSDDGDSGNWNDNPWYIGRRIEVSIGFQTLD